MTYGRKIEPTETLTALHDDDATYRDDWEAVIAEQVSSLPLALTAEVIGTGGGCTAVVTTDGATDVVLTTMDGDYLFGVYRVNAECPDIHGWYDEQSIAEDTMDADCTLDEAAERFAALVETHCTMDTPYMVQRFADASVPFSFIDESLHASAVDALDYASNLSTWTDPTYHVGEVRVIDARTGHHDVHTFTSPTDALAVFERAVGRC